MIFLSSEDYDAINLPKGSKLSPLAFDSRMVTGACSLTFQMQILASVEQETKWRESGLQARSCTVSE